MEKRITIQNWYVTSKSDPYSAPELMRKVIAGNVYGHDEFTDGTPIYTSSIVEAEGRNVNTYSGSKYQLGKIANGYRKWLKENRPNWDWRNPITTIYVNGEHYARIIERR
ncbi:MAG: hypothetical protein KKD77_20145 [Gammaproteobacteria bacterium]|nr:hypothetical protein [Gammaproteobacteria bacterium]